MCTSQPSPMPALGIETGGSLPATAPWAGSSPARQRKCHNRKSTRDLYGRCRVRPNGDSVSGDPRCQIHIARTAPARPDSPFKTPSDRAAPSAMDGAANLLNLPGVCAKENVLDPIDLAADFRIELHTLGLLATECGDSWVGHNKARRLDAAVARAVPELRPASRSRSPAESFIAAATALGLPRIS